MSKPGSQPTLVGGRPLKSTSRRDSIGRIKVRVSPSTSDVLIDPETIKEWDDEELARGQRRAKDGKFRGRPPTVIPREVLLEQNRRRLDAANDKLVRSVDKAVEALAQIVVSSQDDKARVKAAELIMMRVMGKVETNLNVTHGLAEPAWLKLLKNAALVGDAKELPESTVIDVEGSEVDWESE